MKFCIFTLFRVILDKGQWAFQELWAILAQHTVLLGTDLSSVTGLLEFGF